MNNPEETREEATPETDNAAPAPETLEGSSDAVQADVERFRDLALRTQADFENFRKRSIRDREDAVKANTAALIERILPVIDNFEFGLQAARTEGTQAVIVGFEMIYKQLNDFLADSGVEVIDAEGKEFDHNLHEALKQEASDTVPDGHIVLQVRKGYKYKDRLIRPANVIVSKGPETAE